MDILILILIIAGILASFLSITIASIVAYVALVLTYFAGGAIGVGTLVFWGAALAIVIALRFMLPESVNAHREGTIYITAGGVGGLFIGVAVFPSATPAAIIVATILGALAYATTPGGKAVLQFPSRKAVNYLCAKGLPVIVALTMIYISFASLHHIPTV